MTHLIPGGVLVAALIASLWAIYVTVAPRIGQIIDALYGHPRPPETSAQRWRRVHMDADRNKAAKL